MVPEPTRAGRTATAATHMKGGAFDVGAPFHGTETGRGPALQSAQGWRLS